MPVTVKVNRVPVAAFLTRAEVKLALPDESVTRDALPLTAPLQLPLTVAPETGLPLPSRTVTEAKASVPPHQPLLVRRLMAMSCTDVILGTSKLAVTLRAALMLTVQVLLVPEQAPDQPAKVEPEAAAAVSVTLVPAV
jgi:hypothetical protein